MILAFDTSGAYCAAALLRDDGTIATRVDDMARGQAEHLMPMLEAFLAEHHASWSDLTRLGVGIGPGNFTGIRIAVSAARGLALGLNIPAIGVSTLEALLERHPDATVAVRAPRDMLYIQSKATGPRLVPADTVTDPVFATDIDTAVTAMAQRAADPIADITTRPKPLYIKPADAAPSRDTAPVILP